ncbi:copper chaperone CopZ [Clostridium acetobutylicum]|uniref:Heavy-metal binding protein (Similar to N-terminal domain of MerA) n=1 Tax=Clostridium acetobutylicum (strain ATCC 824 / DSM 792 / JCM 1419 / IAM 19013 / LMG 5710 / NBRC 13948 / NRRL B-527 / VKM B-1787 / 2291 / W) TaxID=272562 RepID=Q97D28_CLOAB|nr:MULTISPECIES: heavy-metal-associated domain-containing protein [Clostridium]AAK81576.1 Heavy-metal binding protein (similar to N-terminal domain of MerA) [Clostridium acetobutylicum ATCC 824]ADZ22698.1 Heavy-metal binding protein [Clostridium acetobutylicum EA 2018]AEI34549.1 heavy metal-binding domain-containing protein [Clostridium acetobutylicum DSM 1731]AWV80750.1 copper chaperone [Clostridium acetobutylicum]MBC2393925.1 heavy-metal-associated domain-containing protein [Clostridium acet
MGKKISIEGMSCEHCVAHVKEALEGIGAEKIDVNLKRKSAFISNNITDEKIKTAIEDAGYEVTNIEEASEQGGSKLKGLFKKITG